MRESSSMSAAGPRVSIVVPVHNGVEYTRRFLESLSRVSYPSFELIVIDDGSTDGTADVLRQHHPFDVRVIEGDGGLWWTRAVNLGVSAALGAGSDYILTINNDTVVEPDFIGHLVKCSMEEGGAIVGPMICHLNEPSKVWSAAGRISWYSGKLFYTTDKGVPDKASYSDRRHVQFVHGMGALVPAGVYRKIGLYDQENYPQYHADAEFSMRAGRAGFGLMIEPKSVIYNDVRHSRAMDIRKKLDLISPLFDPYSPYNLRQNLRFYREYAPDPAARYLGYIIKYLRFFMGVFRHMFRA